MKCVSILLLLTLPFLMHAQTPDTLPAPVRDTFEVVTEELPVLVDTIQYNETSIIKTADNRDSLVVRKRIHSPRKATIRSAIIPGWGQVYNEKYWKVPIVYAGIGVPVYLFFDNKQWYERTRYALSIVANNRYSNADSLAAVHPQLMPWVDRQLEGSLLNYRNEFRRSMDYSILFVLLMWGLNIVDATVDGHLKGFDVSDDLGLRIRPTLINHSMTPGISLVLHFK